MCGIVGYIGKNKACRFLLSGLKNLEYRGYDSCGIALIQDHSLQIIKIKGEVDKLIQKTENENLDSTIGIGHTRWATHGKPSQKNAHPHTDCNNKIAVVHNGIVENYQQLKSKLKKEGHHFKSETDTEVIPHLIEKYLHNSTNNNFLKATQKALKKVQGAYAVAVISADHPGEIILARFSSPLLFCLNKDKKLIASDQPALINWSQKLGSLKDGQVARLTEDGIEIKNIAGSDTSYQRIQVEKEARAVSKQGYPHFMLKEIHEQPNVVKNALRGRFKLPNTIKLGGIETHIDDFITAKYLPLIGCGTSLHALIAGKIFFQQLANLPCLVENGTELGITKYPWPKKNPAIFASQSGETADILNALKQAKEEGTKTFGLVNVVGSTVARETAAGIYTRAGYEIGVAATKTFTAQLLALLLWSLKIGESRGIKQEAKLYAEIPKIPQTIKNVLQNEESIKNLVAKLSKKEKIYILGRGLGLAASLEAALKIKEISYIPAEGLPAGELKHGPLALVDRDTALIFLVPDDKYSKKNINSINETKARGGDIITVTNSKQTKNIPGKICPVPHCHPLLSVFPITVWLQLLSYNIAKELGRPIDKPRNLAKSVTVD